MVKMKVPYKQIYGTFTVDIMELVIIFTIRLGKGELESSKIHCLRGIYLQINLKRNEIICNKY